MTAQGDFFPRRINQHVPKMQYAADIRHGGVGTIHIPAMVAAAGDGILKAQSIAAAGAVYGPFDPSVMGKFGRNITVVASGASTAKITVHGADYLGQKMVEELTLNGTTVVAGKKAFKHIDKIEHGATAGTTIDVGYGIVLGLPYRIVSLISEAVDNSEPANAGDVVAGLATDAAQSKTTGDPRGTYSPHSSVAPDGVHVYTVTALWDNTNLHGDAQFVG